MFGLLVNCAPSFLGSRAACLPVLFTYASIERRGNVGRHPKLTGDMLHVPNTNTCLEFSIIGRRSTLYIMCGELSTAYYAKFTFLSDAPMSVPSSFASKQTCGEEFGPLDPINPRQL